MDKITSFTINHLELLPGVYVSRKDKADNAVITTFDIRMTRPNFEPVMNTAEVHTIEHLAATFLRNHSLWKERVLYFGPMGCRTGFYFLVRDMEPAVAIKLVNDMLAFVADFEGAIPGATEVECGNYREQDLEGAKEIARTMIPILKDWTVEKLAY